MTSGDNVVRLKNLRIEKVFANVLSIFLTSCWGSQLERDVPGLAADHELVPRNVARGEHGLNRRADRPFGPLASVIDRRVDQIGPRAYSVRHGPFIRFVVGVSVLAEISANTNRGDGDSERRGSKPDSNPA